MIKKALLVLLIVVAVGVLYFCTQFNDYQTDGEITLSILDAPVTVDRDVLGIPYIHADSTADGLRAQGFITAQDRFFQMELYKHLGAGRLSELFGERSIKMDVITRTVGIPQLAAQQIGLLNDEARNFYQHYIDGVNAYIETREDEFPASFSLLGHQPKPWTLQDIIAIQFFQTWGSTANWKVELLAQQMIDALGPEMAQALSMVTINPDENIVVEPDLLSAGIDLGLKVSPELYAALPEPSHVGSNAWASDGKKSANGLPIFSNSPHIDARTMPGFWYPMGLFTPDFRAIGGTSPGTPGYGLARTEDVVFGATNGNSDGVDLYIEQLDPAQEDHYLQAGESLPLAIREEVILIKDSEAEGGFREHDLRVRSTVRGPLISDHGIALNDDRAISLRWASFGALSDSMGMDKLLTAKSVDDLRNALKQVITPLSYVVADRHGDIARISTGHVPIRTGGDGSRPVLVNDVADVVVDGVANGGDDWAGIIPADEMPVDMRPTRGWAGTANHRVVKQDYPYAYSSFFAASWRYRRISEFMEQHTTVSAEDHRSLINDIKNPMAETLLSVLVPALAGDEKTLDLARALTAWDLRDSIDSSAATIFQVLIQQIVKASVSDIMDEELFIQYMDSSYFWEERFVLLLQQSHNAIFDNVNTPETEGRDDIIVQAGLATIEFLNDRLGSDATAWRWGDLHTITFSSPVIPGKGAAKWLGGGVHPMFGSGQTLNRGGYRYSSDFDASSIDSIRFVADMSDSDKVMSVIPGGSNGRYLNAHLHDQTQTWLQGGTFSWWFSDEKIAEHSVHQLMLKP